MVGRRYFCGIILKEEEKEEEKENEKEKEKEKEKDDDSNDDDGQFFWLRIVAKCYSYEGEEGWKKK